MYKKLLAASALFLACLDASAGRFFVVVPAPGKAANAASDVTVSLAGASLPAGLVGTPYAGANLNSMLSVKGDPNYTGYGVRWSLDSGRLPSGLTLSANGTISGTPTEATSAPFQVKATYKTKSGQQGYQIVVANITVSLTEGSPPQALVGKAYSYDLKPLLKVTGADAYNGSDVAWSVVSSSLSAGLTLRTDGTISGTPTAYGNGSITARATYHGVNGEQTYQIVTLGIEVRMPQSVPPQAIVGTPYSYDLGSQVQLRVNGASANDGSGVTWAVTGGSLPPGLTLSPTGVISGTPTGGSSSSAEVRATYRGVTGQNYYTVQALEIHVSLATATQWQAIAGVPVSFNLKTLLTVSGDPSFNYNPYNPTGITWTVVSSSLPAGLTLRTDGTISGTAQTAGTGSLTARATYRGVDGQQTYQIVVQGITVVLAPTTPPAAIARQPYHFDLTSQLSLSGDGVNGTDRVTWSVVDSSLPAGLYLSSNGAIDGTPAWSGNGSITARATYRGVSTDQTYNVTVNDLQVNLNPAYDLPAGNVGQPYAYDLRPLLSVSGDNAFDVSNATWTVVSSSLPAGLYLTSSGTLSGTPYAGGYGNITVQVSYRGVTTTQSYPVQVQDIKLTFNVPSTGLPLVAINQRFALNLNNWLTVGDPNYQGTGVTWTANSLPTGLTLSQDGTLSGIPADSMGGWVNVVATYRGVATPGSLRFNVASLDAYYPLPAAIVAQPYNFDMSSLLRSTSGSIDPAAVSWRASSNCGIMGGPQATLSGTPYQRGLCNVTVSATYSPANAPIVGLSASYSVNVN